MKFSDCLKFMQDGYTVKKGERKRYLVTGIKYYDLNIEEYLGEFGLGTSVPLVLSEIDFNDPGWEIEWVIHICRNIMFRKMNYDQKTLKDKNLIDGLDIWENAERRIRVTRSSDGYVASVIEDNGSSGYRTSKKTFEGAVDSLLALARSLGPKLIRVAGNLEWKDETDR